MLRVPVYILFVPSKDGDWTAYNRLLNLCREAQKEGWTPIPMITTPLFETKYTDSRLGVEEAFKLTHSGFFGGKIDSVMALWIDGRGSSAYARDVICYAFANNLEVRCLSPRNSLMERYMRPFFIEQIKKTSISRSVMLY